MGSRGQRQFSATRHWDADRRHGGAQRAGLQARRADSETIAGWRSFSIGGTRTRLLIWILPATGTYDGTAEGVDVTDFLSCTRASIGYAQTAAGILTQFAANALRITDLGLLVEDARTNLHSTKPDVWHADGARKRRQYHD